MFLPNKVHINKLAPHSELIIFIGYKNNSYYFVYHIQGNIIFYSLYAIFDKKPFSKYTNSCAKEHKLYDKLLDKINPKCYNLNLKVLKQKMNLVLS